MKLLVLFCLLALSGCATGPITKDAQNTHLAEIDTQLAVLELDDGNPEAAKIHLLDAKRLAPEDALVWAGEGYEAVKMGNFSLAAQYYQQAISLAPSDPVIQDDYGTFLYREGQDQSALTYFLKSASNPDNLYAGEAYQNAAQAELKLKDSKEAAVYFKEAALEDPELTE